MSNLRKLSCLLMAFAVLANRAVAWTPPVDITNLPDYEVGPRAGRDSAGNIHLVWYGGASDSSGWRIYYQRYDGASWSAPVSISGTAAGSPDIAIDGANNLHVVWHANGNPEEIYYRKNTAGTWGAIQNVSNSGSQRSLNSRIAVDPAGNNILVVWHESGQTGGNWDILARKYSSGSWGAIENVSNDSNLSRNSDVAIDASGNFHVVWEDTDSRNAFYRKRNADGTYGSHVTLDATSGRSYYPAIAIAPNGYIHTAWHDDNNDWEIVYRYFDGANWSAIVNVSNQIDPDHADNTASLDVDANGQVHIVWHNYQNIFYAHTVNGMWRPKYIIGPGSVQGGPYVVLGSSNRLHAVWGSRDSGTWDTMHSVQDLPDATAPNPVTNFRAYPTSGQVRLDWSNPSQIDFIGTMIRYKSSGYPTSVLDGVLLTNVVAPANTANHRGLPNNVTNYYSAFAHDAEPNYAAGAHVTGTPVSAPKTNLLQNGAMTNFSSGVATAWSSYKVNDPNNAITFASDASNFESSPSQAILGIDSLNLPVTGLSAAGIRQVVSGLTIGKVYQFSGGQDLYTSDFGADGKRYLHNFGINTTGGTDPGAPNTSGSIGGAKWITSAQAFWNNNSGGSSGFGGFHRARAAFVAESSTISVWTGLTIDNTGARDNVTAKFNADQSYLFEWDFPTNSALENAGFEGNIIDLQDNGDTVPEDWVPCGGGIGQVNTWACSTNWAHSGLNGVRIWSRRGVVNAGFMQRVTANPGSSYTFRAWGRTSGQDNTIASVGIDPQGGGDINSTNIVWQSSTSSTWTQLTVVAVAQGPAITVFVRTLSQNNVGANYQWSDFDETELVAGGVPPVTIIPARSSWKYLDDGSNQGTAWRDPSYTDTGWSNGLAQLGFGDGDESGVIRSNRTDSSRIITYYFRRSFSLNDPGSFTNLIVRLLRDDGAVVYLNGTEIFRSNMTNTPIDYTTLALTSVPAEDETTKFYDTNVNPGLLVSGNNVVAVEVHQNSTNSSDLSFDLELVGMTNSIGNQAPSVIMTSPGNSAEFCAGAHIEMNVDATDNDDEVSMVEFFIDGAKIGQTSDSPYSLIWSNAPAGYHSLTARATDSRGASAISSPVSINVAMSTLINTGAVWKYLDNGSDQQAAWRSLSFDDTPWSAGPAELGYGDAVPPENRPEATIVGYGPSDTNKYITTYFRRSWLVPDSAFFTNLTLRLLRDDGAVVYLNDIEVFRSNMPTGAINHVTPAALSVGGAEETTYFTTNVNPALLRDSTNVLAVEIHQINGMSSDISFDLQLIGATVPIAPRLEISRSGNSALLRWPSAAVGFRLLASTDLSLPIEWQPVPNSAVDDGVWKVIDVATGSGSRFYRLSNR